ncbi:MAG: RIP metalloprotease RseP [Bdellovibrionales bacterium]
MSGILPFIILLGVLIFVHELGHFAMARFFGVRVETFSIGFGHKIFKKTYGDTTYALSWLPLGGYVKMYGDDPTKEVPEDQKKYSFLHQPVWPRIWIVAAGPLVNFFFAIIVFALIAFTGEQRPGPEIGDITPGTAAYEAGFRSGDKITHAGVGPITDEKIVSDWTEIKTVIEENPDRKLEFRVERSGSDSPIELSAIPKLVPNRQIISFYDEVGYIEGLSVISKATVVGISDPNSVFGKAGVENLAMIKKVNGEKVEYWRNLAQVIRNAAQGSDSLEIEYTSYLERSEKPEVKTATVNVENIFRLKMMRPFSTKWDYIVLILFLLE